MSMSAYVCVCEHVSDMCDCISEYVLKFVNLSAYIYVYICVHVFVFWHLHACVFLYIFK